MVNQKIWINEMDEDVSIATLAAGCFWCIEAVYELIEGVSKVVSGYTGGHTDNPSYEEVCFGDTGNAEAAEIHFDPSVISYRTILEIFFSYHDPTTLNKQGPDIGTQYRSAIYHHDKDQEVVAGELIRELDDAKIWPSKIVTEVTPASIFYEAESYHQSYFQNYAYQPYCQFIIAPKVIKLREKHSHLLKSSV